MTSRIVPSLICRAPFCANASAVRRSGRTRSRAWFSVNDASSSGAYSRDRSTVHSTARKNTTAPK